MKDYNYLVFFLSKSHEFYVAVPRKHPIDFEFDKSINGWFELEKEKVKEVFKDKGDSLGSAMYVDWNNKEITCLPSKK